MNVSGFTSKFFPVSSINFCQCLQERRQGREKMGEGGWRGEGGVEKEEEGGE